MYHITSHSNFKLPTPKHLSWMKRGNAYVIHSTHLVTGNSQFVIRCSQLSLRHLCDGKTIFSQRKDRNVERADGNWNMPSWPPFVNDTNWTLSVSEVAAASRWPKGKGTMRSSLAWKMIHDTPCGRTIVSENDGDGGEDQGDPICVLVISLLSVEWFRCYQLSDFVVISWGYM